MVRLRSCRAWSLGTHFLAVIPATSSELLVDNKARPSDGSVKLANYRMFVALSFESADIVTLPPIDQSARLRLPPVNTRLPSSPKLSAVALALR
jgi:hypothetical protein